MMSKKRSTSDSKKVVEDEEWLWGGNEQPKDTKSLAVNEDFARRYESKKRDERIQVLEAEVEALEDSIASEEEEEDEMGELVTGKVSAEFLDVLNMIRNGDPKLYDKEARFFDDEADDDVEGDDAVVAKPVVVEAKKKTLVEQEKQLKKELLEAAGGGGGNDGDDDNLLLEVPQTQEQRRRAEEEYKEFLARTKEQKIQQGGATMANFWAAPKEKLSENDAFLRDYILGNAWVHDEDIKIDEEELAALSESEEMLDRVDDFERKLNFRHEEPGNIGPVSYPRNVPSVRAPKPTARKAARQRSAEQKKAEKARLAEELKRLKAEKRKEIMEKMKRNEREIDDEEDEVLREKLANMSQKEMAKFLDDYLKMDYEDVVGGIKTRYEYQEVEPNTFGLEPEDILRLPDETLEKYVPLKGIAPHRASEWQPSHKKAKWIESKLEKVKRQQEEDEGEEQGVGVGKGSATKKSKKESKKKKKKNKKSKKSKNKE